MHLDQENSSDMTAGQSPEWHDIQFDDPDEHDLQLHGGKGQRPDRQQHGRGDGRENHVSVRLVEAAGQRLQCGGAAGESAALVRRLHLRRLWESDGHDRQRRGALAQRIGECGDQPDFAYQHFVRWEWERDQFGPSGSLTTMAYNVANRMATVNSTNAYAYDPASQRVYFRNSAGTETLYVYGTGGKKLATYTIAGITGSQVNFTMQSQNVYFGGKLISTEGNAVAVDRLGSVRWNAASGGHTYYPYGVEYSATTNDTEKYATYTRDTLTGLDYTVNRFYTSSWGRFMSPDPSSANVRPREPQSWNRYAYGGTDPGNQIDPTGLYLTAQQCIADPDACIAQDGGQPGDPWGWFGGDGGGCPDPSGNPFDPTPPSPEPSPCPPPELPQLDCPSVTFDPGQAVLAVGQSPGSAEGVGYFIPTLFDFTVTGGSSNLVWTENQTVTRQGFVAYSNGSVAPQGYFGPDKPLAYSTQGNVTQYSDAPGVYLTNPQGVSHVTTTVVVWNFSLQVSVSDPITQQQANCPTVYWSAALLWQTIGGKASVYGSSWQNSNWPDGG